MEALAKRALYRAASPCDRLPFPNKTKIRGDIRVYKLSAAPDCPAIDDFDNGGVVCHFRYSYFGRVAQCG
jgi:hypothetical protein